jgi:hypothetical protein
MTYRDSVLGKNPLEFEPHAGHGLPMSVSRGGRKDSKREFGHLERKHVKHKRSKDDGKMMAARETRTAAAISGIFFFHSASSEDLRYWFEISTTENLCVKVHSICMCLPGHETAARHDAEMVEAVGDRSKKRRRFRKIGEEDEESAYPESWASFNFCGTTALHHSHSSPFACLLITRLPPLAPPLAPARPT